VDENFHDDKYFNSEDAKWKDEEAHVSRRLSNRLSKKK